MKMPWATKKKVWVSEWERVLVCELNPFAWTFPGALPSVSMIYDGQYYFSSLSTFGY